MVNRMTLSLALIALALGGCRAKTDPEPSKETLASVSATTPSAAQAPPKPEQAEVVFDPRKPPPGFRVCHRNHCHRVGGGVASYAQVMKEIGATKIVGVPKKVPMPPAPPDVAGPGPDAEITGSGVASKVLKKGDGGAKPGPTSVVTVHYTGWLASNGKGFDSSVARGKPATLPLNRVFPGWSEAMQLMTVGEERRVWIPEHLAFKGRKGSPPGMLVFDIELLGIK